MRVFFLILISAHFTYGQVSSLKKIKEINIQPNTKRISVDRLGGFYTISDCAIEQFSPEGKLTGKYSLDNCNPIELLEAWPLMRIFGYQHAQQQFIVFDHNLDIVDKIDIDPAFAVEPQLATPSSDLKSYWILDIDNSVKQIDNLTNSVSIETEALKDITGKFTYMREYQNMLFLLNSTSGFYVLNKLGQLIFKVEVSGARYFSFLGEDLYYLKDTQLHFYNIFSRDNYHIDIPAGVNFVVATDEKLILLMKNSAILLSWQPKN